MLDRLTLANFTAFPHAEFKFSRGLNVIVGENGLGKTHVLKAAYSTVYMSSKGKRDSGSANPTKAHVQTALAKHLNAVFKPDSLGRLARRRAPGRARCEVSCAFAPPKYSLRFSFNTSSRSEVTVDKTPSAWIPDIPVYFPTRELLTIFPGFVSLYETTQTSFEQTWRDTCILLGAPLARGPRLKQIKALLEPIESAMGGKLVLEDSKGFYLKLSKSKMEVNLVAEGHRKLAMIARLIATGVLQKKGYLYWDEPEANLNPNMTKLVARTIVHLCQSGIQVTVATHSLFLIREFDILLRTEEFKGTPSRFFGLHSVEDGAVLTQGNTVDEIGDITSLQEELAQSDRYLAQEGE